MRLGFRSHREGADATSDGAWRDGLTGVTDGGADGSGPGKDGTGDLPGPILDVAPLPDGKPPPDSKPGPDIKPAPDVLPVPDVCVPVGCTIRTRILADYCGTCTTTLYVEFAQPTYPCSCNSYWVNTAIQCPSTSIATISWVSGSGMQYRCGTVSGWKDGDY